MSDLIERQAAIDVLDVGAELLRRVLDDLYIVGIELEKYKWGLDLIEAYIEDMKELPSAQQDQFVDADKLKRCRFEYINACKTITYQTPDTSKGDIHDAYAVIKALHPIFNDEEF